MCVCVFCLFFGGSLGEALKEFEGREECQDRGWVGVQLGGFGG